MGADRGNDEIVRHLRVLYVILEICSRGRSVIPECCTSSSRSVVGDVSSSPSAVIGEPFHVVARLQEAHWIPAQRTAGMTELGRTTGMTELGRTTGMTERADHGNDGVVDTARG